MNIGDPAPPLRVGEWIKGEPFDRYKRGKIYILEFWATWCKPCISIMPDISNLARKYKEQTVFLGIDIEEKESTSVKKIKSFVDSMGNRMDYNIALEDKSFTVNDWINAADEGNSGIPRTFVVDAEGKLAWIGHPKDLDTVLQKIINRTWNLAEVSAKRISDKRIAKIDDSLRLELFNYQEDPYNPFKPHDLGKPDSTLLIIEGAVKKEPKLKYAYYTANFTFSSLLKTNPHEAINFIKVMVNTPEYAEDGFNILINNTELYFERLKLPLKIFEMCAEGYQFQINIYSRFGNMNIPNNYSKMAKMYWLSENKFKAIESIENAIKILKSDKEFSKTELANLEAQLSQYKKEQSN